MSLKILTFGLWPALILLNMYAKFDGHVHNSSVFIAFRSLLPYMSIVILTSKINRVHLLTMVNMSAKFDEDAQNGSVSIVFIRLFLEIYVQCDLDLQSQ